MWSGTYPALSTPFAGDRLDEDALRRLVRYVVAGGVEGIVACGTTGEAPALTVREWSQVVAVCVDECRDVPVIAGTGTNNTQNTVARTKLARELGVAAALVVAPYYNKPTQRGLVAHFTRVAEEGKLPVILYNIPGRTGVNMTAETIAELSRVPGIVGVKEAAGSMDQVGAILEKAAEGFAVLSGDDSLCLPMYALGGHGVISTTATLAPALMGGMYRAFRDGRVAQARAAHYKLLPLFRALFAETNPAPLKYALSRLGLGANELRLPLVPVTEATERMVDEALAGCGLRGGNA
ncbi:MAG: 4-hydroxy-tetrahydrodipicolinate synthase [Deltaproteobacteria bacterium]|nr:4-hydroxy-tetrahydrodipicolinate synthase [Deltaproteobacteria bacterium]